MNDLFDSIARAEVYELGYDVHIGMPVSLAHTPFQLLLSRRHGDVVRNDGVSTASETIVMSSHTGTHIDALGHASANGIVHGGVEASTIESHLGLRTLGAEALPPILAPAVLFDVPRFRGVAALDAGDRIPADELEAILDHNGLDLTPGSCALVRTGWGAYWEDQQKFRGDVSGLPGPDSGAAQWLADRGVLLVGSDTVTFEAIDPVTNSRPGHRILLVESGVYIVEALNLEAIAADGIAQLVFCALPLRLRGATGSPIRPVGLVPRS